MLNSRVFGLLESCQAACDPAEPVRPNAVEPPHHMLDASFRASWQSAVNLVVVVPVPGRSGSFGIQKLCKSIGLKWGRVPTDSCLEGVVMVLSLMVFVSVGVPSTFFLSKVSLRMLFWRSLENTRKD